MGLVPTLRVGLVPTLRVGMHPGRSASRAPRSASGSHAPAWEQVRALRVLANTGRGAPARHSHAGAWEREAAAARPRSGPAGRPGRRRSGYAALTRPTAYALLDRLFPQTAASSRLRYVTAGQRSSCYCVKRPEAGALVPLLVPGTPCAPRRPRPTPRGALVPTLRVGMPPGRSASRVRRRTREPPPARGTPWAAAATRSPSRISPTS